jgi:hypothetical protein
LALSEEEVLLMITKGTIEMAKIAYIEEWKIHCKLHEGQLLESSNGLTWQFMTKIKQNELNIINERLGTDLTIDDIRTAALKNKAHLLLDLLKTSTSENDFKE